MIRHYQTTAPLAQGTLGLVGSCVSPYFQRSSLQKIGPTRDIPILVLMKAIYGLDWGLSNGSSGYVGVGYIASGAVVEGINLPFDLWGSTSAADAVTKVEAAITAYAITQSYTLNEGIFGLGPKIVLAGMPQAAVADSPADATTNYNVVTTLLGALTGAVNTANTKQNAIAVQLNSLLAELRTLGLIST